MKVYKEISLQEFEWWGGARCTAQEIEEAGKWDELENLISELYPDGIDETKLNNILWLEDEWVFECLDIE